jgi:hypothetical protein
MTLRATSLAALIALGLVACRTSRPPQGTATPELNAASSGDICAVRAACADLPEPSTEEVDACVAFFEDHSPCREENAQLFACSLRATRCTEAGGLDEAASLDALESECGETQRRLERCCEGGVESVHCEMLDEEDEAEQPEEGQLDGEAPQGTKETT